VSEWAILLLRWAHIFAGILWIGQTWLFALIERALGDAEKNPGGKVFMIHSGGLYIVERRKTLEALPTTLHWFRWEAAFTWLSGIALLVLMYYLGGLMTSEDSAWSERAAIGGGAASVAVGWVLYDQLWLRTPKRLEPVGAAVSYGAVVAAAYGLWHVMPGRAAYMHVGALLGTLMTANVWERIIPGQRAMVAAMREGRAPDLALGERARQRSKHNTFMVVPLVFIMVSNHFPTATYGRTDGWLVLAVLLLLGAGAAAILRRR
jgi:uncharacterized membrane protein